MRSIVTSLIAVFLVACADEPEATARYGPVEVIRTPASFAEDVEIIVSDVHIAPGAEVPGHSHAAEELVYVIEGLAIHVEEGLPERTLRPGDMAVIPPETVHRPRGGPDGARAITVRFKLPEREERDAAPTSVSQPPAEIPSDES
ncbi:MAG: cupin domain-containing protein [Woeseiaceae bacterium]|nr:cupin domain-containing protein [Woeseiaceae bacterium]